MPISKTVREEVLMEVAKLDRRGYLQADIARAVRITKVQVGTALRTIQKRYAEATLSERTVLVEEKCYQLREVRKELWEAWERSKDDAKRLVEESAPEAKCAVCDGKGIININRKNKDGNGSSVEAPCRFCVGKGTVGGVVKTVATTEGRLPGAEYMKLIIESLRDERKLLGLDVPLKVEADLNVLNWDALIEEVGGEEHDTIEGEILKVLNGSKLPIGLKELEGTGSGIENNPPNTHSNGQANGATE